jgi:hypothetical protein
MKAERYPAEPQAMSSSSTGPAVTQPPRPAPRRGVPACPGGRPPRASLPPVSGLARFVPRAPLSHPSLVTPRKAEGLEAAGSRTREGGRPHREPDRPA